MENHPALRVREDWNAKPDPSGARPKEKYKVWVVLG